MLSVRKPRKYHARTDGFSTQERQVSMSGKYTKFEKQANGNLRIVLLPEARIEVEEIASKEMDADSRLAETIEWQLSNGWSLLRPEDIGALTEAPILSEEVDYDDQGNIDQVGTVYWYPQYDVFDPVGQLLTNGFVEFVRGE
jgi:hypothetical protein